jgi:hypothetical protein
MKLRKYVTGEAAGGLVKLIVIAVLIMILLPKLKSCAEEAPKQAADLAAQAGNEIADAITDTLSSAADAALNEAKDAVCSVPVVGRACDRGSSQPAGSPNCLTLDQAASKALALARSGTLTAARCGIDLEFAGNLYAYDGAPNETCYDFDKPTAGGSASASTKPDPSKLKPHPNVRAVATYHSHPPGRDYSARFSVTDLCNYVAHKQTGYVVATSQPYSMNGHTFGGDDGAVRRFVPNTEHTFPVNELLRECMLLRTASSGDWRDSIGRWWLATAVCPAREAWFDSHNPDFGTIDRLDDIPAAPFPGCPVASSNAATSPAAPPTVAVLDNLYKACTAPPAP